VESFSRLAAVSALVEHTTSGSKSPRWSEDDVGTFERSKIAARRDISALRSAKREDGNWRRHQEPRRMSAVRRRTALFVFVAAECSLLTGIVVSDTGTAC
jgi:hypothetical protein